MFGECHAHAFMNGADFKQAVADHRDAPREALVRQMLQAYQDQGVPFVRDGGDAFGVSVLARKLAPEYGICYRTPVFAIHKKGCYGGIVGRGFGDMKEYHQLVLEVRRQGGDFIKIMLSGILDFSIFGKVSQTTLSRGEIREMIHIAHQEGFHVMAHVNETGPVSAALEAGVDSVEHGFYLDENCLSLLARSGAVWVPTLSAIRNLLGSGLYDDGVIGEIAAAHQEAIKTAFEKGALLALGSDAGAICVPHGQGVVDELDAFCRIIPDRQGLEERLAQGEERIRQLF